MTTIAFFNNKGGVGKTTLVYHLAHMFAELEVGCLAVDLDPQANLSAMCLDEDRLQDIWQGDETLRASVQPLVDQLGDIAPAHAEPIASGLHLLVGDLRLSTLEDALVENWNKCLEAKAPPFRWMSAFHRIMAEAATRVGAGVTLMDLGPNLGALNRAALLAADHIVVPLAPDLFSIQGLENLGPTLRRWQKDWKKRLDEAEEAELDVDLPLGTMNPLGYVVMSFGARDNRPVQAYDPWLQRIPAVYRTAVLNKTVKNPPSVLNDPECLATLKHYRSLVPLAMTAHKPMFKLRSADGAIGAHQEAVRNCYRDFERLARRIAEEAEVDLEAP